MKKLYYFSSSKLQFVEVKNFKKKVIIYFSAAILILTTTVYGSLNFITEISGSGKSLSTLKEENKLLQNKLLETSGLYKKLDSELDSLVNENNTLRIAANLPPVSDEEKQVGVGGGYLMSTTLSHFPSHLQVLFSIVIPACLYQESRRW